MTPPDATVFVVDDDEDVRDSLERLFQSEGFEVRTFPSGAEFLSAYEPGRAGCLVLDIQMPDMDGFELNAKIAERGIGLPVIMITGYSDPATKRRAKKVGVLAVLDKPFRKRVLLDAVEEAIARNIEGRRSRTGPENGS